jgi:hypothetical protein
MPWDSRGSDPPDAGIIAGTDGGADNAVSFKTGTGDKEGHTLVSDGDKSDDADKFDGDYDHAFPADDDNPDGYHDEGAYTGPGGGGS